MTNPFSLEGKTALVVIGAGLIGLFVLPAARKAGASVVVADLLDSKRALAERLGADATFDSGAPDAATAAMDGFHASDDPHHVKVLVTIGEPSAPTGGGRRV